MDIIWHGHACFEIRSGRHSIVFDPHDGKSMGIKPPSCRADIVLVSRRHFGHCALHAIGGCHTDIVAAEGEHTVGGIRILGLPVFRGGISEEGEGNVMYMVELEGITLCHCGDLEDMPSEEVLETLKGSVDILFVPAGESCRISAEKLKTFVSEVGADIVVPFRFGTGGMTLPAESQNCFLSGIDCRSIIDVGNAVELAAEDLPEFSGYWIFDR